MDDTKKPMSYNSIVGTLCVDSPINNDYLCENPWPIRGIEAEPWSEVGNDSLSDIISRAVREAIKEDNLQVTPKIEKYHIKHR